MGQYPTKRRQRRLLKTWAVLKIFSHGPKPSKQRVLSGPIHQVTLSNNSFEASKAYDQCVQICAKKQ